MQGGVAEQSRKYRGASTDRKSGVVFRSTHARKTTPSAPAKEASRHLIYGAATPPCCDARRGVLHSCNSFTGSMTARISLIAGETGAHFLGLRAIALALRGAPYSALRGPK